MYHIIDSSSKIVKPETHFKQQSIQLGFRQSKLVLTWESKILKILILAHKSQSALLNKRVADICPSLLQQVWDLSTIINSQFQDQIQNLLHADLIKCSLTPR